MRYYPLAPNGIFRTVQGEGALLGVPMVFVRLAGCSIGCSGCDTDYRVSERPSVAEVCDRVEAVRNGADWTWVTGGEPTDHDLWPLLHELRGRVALATSGAKDIGPGPVDFLSVSPHGKPSELVLTRGSQISQINLVPDLNGLDLADWQTFDASGFDYRWVTPFWYGPGDRAERVNECLAFIEAHPGWRLGVQAHKSWGIA